MQKYCRTSPWSAFRSQEIFFPCLLLSFLGRNSDLAFQSYYFPFVFYSVMETYFSLGVFFPAVIPFTDNSTKSCSSLLRKISWQTEATKGGSHCISCQRHLQWFEQQPAATGPPKPYVPSPSKSGTLVCHFTLAAARGWALPGPGAKPSLAPHGCSWSSTTGQGHFSRGIRKGTWLAEAGPALKGSVCSFH